MRTARRGLASILVISFALTAGLQARAETELFPRPASLEPAVRFWTRVYTEVDTQSGFIHDNLRLDVVYETVRFGPNVSQQQRRREIDRKIDGYRQILQKLASGARSNLTAEERRVLDLWPEGVSNGELRAATERLRFQLGQSDRFRAGLVRSGRWKPYIYDVLEQRRLPRELAVLPHVESSFDPTAYSRAGAAGMWQFIRSTGVRYMRIDHIVDERRDPYFSTHAAARLLEDNYAVIQSWPLALTAYNHGLGGMRRAVSQLGTTDIGVIVANYSGRAFGFASRNFYAAFLAALDVDSNPERYFGPIRLDQPPDLVVARMPSYMTAGTVAGALGVGVRELREYNPALTAVVWREEKYVPRGFQLRVPRRPNLDVATALASVPATQAFAAQRPDVEHRVQPGDTLSQIAQRYRVSLASLMEINNLNSRDFIRAGQVLTLPLPGAPAPTLAEADQPPVLAAGDVYVVRTGDSIERIARTFGVDQTTLLAANGIRDRNRIYAGQELRIPGTGGSAQPAREAAVVAAADIGERETAVSTVSLLGSPAAAEPQEERRAPPVADTATASAEREIAVTAAEMEIALAAAEPEDTPGAIGAEAETTDPDANVLASIQADLAADPSDYTVSTDDTIEVQALETLGHYADWLGIPTQRLRDINSLSFQRALVLGQRLRLDFSRVDRATFERRRMAYHQGMQEAFFARYYIADIEAHVVRRGESLWVLTQRTYNVPVWLLRQYNPDLDLDRVQPGMVIKFPVLRPAMEGETQA